MYHKVFDLLAVEASKQVSKQAWFTMGANKKVFMHHLVDNGCESLICDMKNKMYINIWFLD